MKSADEEAATHPDIVSIDPFASLSLVRLDRSEPGWLHRVCLLHEFHSSRQLQKPPGLPVCSLPPWPSPPGGGRERCSWRREPATDAARGPHGGRRCPQSAWLRAGSPGRRVKPPSSSLGSLLCTLTKTTCFSS